MIFTPLGRESDYDTLEARNDELQSALDEAADQAAGLRAQIDNHDKANAWFREPENARTLDPKIEQTATAYDPQWNAKSIKDIRISFNDAELKRYLGLGKQAHALKVFPKEPPLAKKTNMTMAKELDAKPWAFDPKTVKVK